MAYNFAPETRGVIRLKSESYGKTALGTDLRYFPSTSDCKLLVMAGIHGEEPETTFLLSRVLRAFDSNFRHASFILCANPDGMTYGTRGNSAGVDLNRNFKTSNWSAEPVESRSVLEASRDTILSPGVASGSEPETKALASLVSSINPKSILSLHAPIGCVDAPSETDLVKSLEHVFGLPWVPDIGYATPGSLGTWCKEWGLECVTLELPRMSLEQLFDRYGKGFAEFLDQYH